MEIGNNFSKMEEILKNLYVSVKEQNISLTSNDVYQYLIKYDVPIQSRNKKVSNRYAPYLECREDFFSKWIHKFRNILNINVFWSDKHKCFCQFTNGVLRRDCVKMYVPLDYDYLYEGASSIFSYLSANNISHQSKIGSHIRFDNIVIRLNSLEDAMKLQKDVLDKEPVIRRGLIKTNCFAFNNNGIGYAYDGMLSYNSYLAGLISSYINERVNNNKSVSVLDFYSYVDGVSKNFDTIKSFVKDEGDNNKVVDACLIIELIKMALRSDKIDDYYKFIDIVQNSDVREQLFNQFVYKESETKFNEFKVLEYDQKEELFKEMILVTMKKYPTYQKGIDNEYDGIDYINGFYNGNINSVTRDNNLRSRGKRICFSGKDIPQIIKDSYVGEGSLTDYVKMVMLEDIIENMRGWVFRQNPKIDVDRVVAKIIDNFIDKNKPQVITRDSGARSLAMSFGAIDMKKFLARYDVSNVMEYMDKYMNKDKISVRR